MKKQKITICSGLVLAALMSVGINSGMVSAEDSATETRITFTYFEQGDSQETTCKFYDSSSYNIYADCAASYGNYNVANKTLTLGTGINNLSNGRVNIRTDDITISADGNISSAISINSADSVTLDFGSYSFADKPYKYTTTSENDERSTSFRYANKLIVKSGTITIPELIAYGPVEIRGGKATAQYLGFRDSLKISGGTTAIINEGDFANGISSSNEGGTVLIEDGSVTISAETGFFNVGNTTITGGDITITASKSSSSFGIDLSTGSDLTISGGTLTIDGYNWGISATASKLYFNGGTTTIKNAKTHSIWITDAEDPENDIVFADGMGMLGNTYVFWEKYFDKGSTGIAEGSGNAKEVIITEGGKVRRHYGFETIDEDTSGSSDVKVPDTGSMSESGQTIAIVTATASIPVMLVLLYIADKLVKQHKNHVKFD